MKDTLLHSGKFLDVDGNEITVSFYKRMYIEVSPELIDVGSSFNSRQLHIFTRGEGTLSASTVSWMTYSAYDKQVANGYNFYAYDIIILPNDSYNRSTSLTFTLTSGPDAGKTVDVVIKQSGPLGPPTDLEVSPMILTYAASGGTEDVSCTWTLGGNPTISLVYGEGQSGWLTQTIEEGSEEGNIDITLTAAANNTVSGRNATLNIENDYEVKVVSISQFTTDVDVEPIPLEIPASSSYQYVYVIFKITWRDESQSYLKEPTYSIEYVTGEPGWLMYNGDPSHYNGDQESYLRQSLIAEKNNTGSTRTAKINIYRKADYSDPDSPDVFKYALDVIQPSN